MKGNIKHDSICINSGEGKTKDRIRSSFGKVSWWGKGNNGKMVPGNVLDDGKFFYLDCGRVYTTICTLYMYYMTITVNSR